jgi:hypothetical protein
VMDINRHPTEQGWTTPVVGLHHRPGEAGFSLRWQLRGPISYHNADPRLLIRVGLLLLQAWWRHWWRPSSCGSSSLLRRGSWKAREEPSPHGRMDWRCLSVPWEGCTQNTMPSAHGLRPSCRTTWLGCALLPPAIGAPLALTKFWRSVELSFLYRRLTKKGGMRS